MRQNARGQASHPSLGARALRAVVTGIIIAGLIAVFHWIRKDGETSALTFAASALAASIVTFVLDFLPRVRARRRSVAGMSLATAVLGALAFTANGLFGGGDWTPIQWLSAVAVGAACGAVIGALLAGINNFGRRRDSVAA
jgi:hypothetical protein